MIELLENFARNVISGQVNSYQRHDSWTQNDIIFSVDQPTIHDVFIDAYRFVSLAFW